MVTPSLVRVLVALLLFSLNASACWARPVSDGVETIDTESLESVKENPPNFTGMAHFYADHLHGKPTSSGQLHDKTKMTAAHKTLPFGTKLHVTNKRNGKTCVVTVNDRGPFSPKFVLDVSRAAAEKLGLVSHGKGHVECRVVAKNIATARSGSH
ncbi:MAG: septal ring lytic transglycosylase RlpA family protein [Cyanobacteria bacterium]|nr:septal ring lytic transglycosylase RlpA family protein [Cyanobacteriota bacterium]